MTEILAAHGRGVREAVNICESMKCFTRFFGVPPRVLNGRRDDMAGIRLWLLQKCNM
jgi:hypothetical protein